MTAPILELDAEETAQLRALRQDVTTNPAVLDNVLAELILFRKVAPAIKRLQYLRTAPSVNAIVRRLPGPRGHTRGKP